MKFIVSRTSDYYGKKNRPCENAILIKIKENGEKVHGIKLNSLDELIKMVEKNGPIVIEKTLHKVQGINYEIEIYDGYRE